MASCIQTFNHPSQPLQVTKRVFIFPRYRLQIVDNGERIWAWISNPEGDPSQVARVTTDSTTTAYIRNVRLSVNPFIVPERLLCTSQMHKAIQSYANCTNRLMQAVLCIENTPFPTKMGTFIGVEMEDSRNVNLQSGNGVRVFGPRLVVKDYNRPLKNSSPNPTQERTSEDWRRAEQNAQATGQDIELLRQAEKTNHNPIQIYLPSSSSFRVLLDMGDGYETYEEFDAVTKGAHVWEGTLSVCQENHTLLGGL